MSASFAGFPRGTLSFLASLKRNNNREWFQARKDRYEAEFVAPALRFIEAMQRPLQSISPCLEAIPKKTGGSLMRIYRDTRFSKDKLPYKTNIGIHFRHTAGRNVHAPGCYVHIEPKNVFLGVGTWRPESASLARIREHLAEHPDLWKKAVGSKAFRARFELAGEKLKRPPRGFDAEHRYIEDIKRKDFMGACQLEEQALYRPELVEETIAIFRAARPLLRFLCEAMGVPF